MRLDDGTLGSLYEVRVRPLDSIEIRLKFGIQGDSFIIGTIGIL